MTGVLKRVKTMKMEKIWSVFPVMYMPAPDISTQHNFVNVATSTYR
jgi:hypothetical protein